MYKVENLVCRPELQSWFEVQVYFVSVKLSLSLISSFSPIVFFWSKLSPGNKIVSSSVQKALESTLPHLV